MNPLEERRDYERSHQGEKREFARAVVRLEADVSANEDKTQISGWTRDLSVKGVFVLCTEKLPPGHRCQVRLCLGEPHKGAPVIEVQGKVIRYDDLGVAVQFSEIAVESFKKLSTYFLV